MKKNNPNINQQLNELNPNILNLPEQGQKRTVVYYES